MRFDDLREFIDFLDSHGELKRIRTQVQSELEITEITDRCVKSSGPALYFENVVGFSEPVITNIFGTHQRMAWALGIDGTDQLTYKVRDLLGIIQNPPTSVFDKLKTLKDIVGVARTQPKIVKSAPCQEIVYEGSDADLTKLPHLKCWPMDGGRYITLPIVI